MIPFLKRHLINTRRTTFPSEIVSQTERSNNIIPLIKYGCVYASHHFAVVFQSLHDYASEKKREKNSTDNIVNVTSIITRDKKFDEYIYIFLL